MLYYLRFVSFLAFIAFIVFIQNCRIKEEEQKLSSNDRILKIQGEMLSHKHCSACHMYVNPGVLDKTTWMKILTLMEKEMEKVDYKIEKNDWLTIRDYYNRFSPYNLSFDKEVLYNPSEDFRKIDIMDTISNVTPFVTLLEYVKEDNSLYTGDLNENLFVFKNQELQKSYQINNIAVDVDINPKKNTIEVLGIGSFMPSEDLTGQLIEIDEFDNQKILIDSMKRATHFLRYDFNDDGQDEYLISCFGSTYGKTNSGNLSLFFFDGERYTEKIVMSKPGPTMSKLIDWNGDGLMDFLTLFSQGDESIILFVNKGNFHFEAFNILRFPPVWGSLYFDLVDMNNDGYLDIVYVNGDNGDQSPIFKPYHGVRIYKNNGLNRFSEEYFFHINGASKAIVSDFDQDGDNDLAINAMYSNYVTRAQETVVFLKSSGKLKYKPFYIEAEPTGRWILMDKLDYDNDGDEDLVVGSNQFLNFHTPDFYKNKWREEGLTFSIFENTSEKDKGFWNTITEIF